MSSEKIIETTLPSIDITEIPIINTIMEEENKTTESMISQLKKLSPELRQQLIEAIMKEEHETRQQQERQQQEMQEQERQQQERQQQEMQEQERQRGSKCMYGKHITAQTHTMNLIMNELRGLRMQVQELKCNQNLCLQQQKKCPITNFYGNSCGVEKELSRELDDDSNMCSVSIFSFEWLPFWIFISFILFALTPKPRICSIIGDGVSSMPSMPSMPSCPFAELSSFCTKL